MVDNRGESFMNLRTAVTVVHGLKEEDDPEHF